jgi:hypothetical protein
MIDAQTPSAEPSARITTTPRGRTRVARLLEYCRTLALCGIGTATTGGLATLAFPRAGVAAIFMIAGSVAIVIAMVAATVLCVKAAARSELR